MNPVTNALPGVGCSSLSLLAQILGKGEVEALAWKNSAVVHINQALGFEWALVGFLLCFSLLHLLIYVYHRGQKSNLYFSLLSFFLAANRIVFVYQTYHQSPVSLNIWLEAFNQILNVVSMVSAVYFIHFIVFDRLDRRLLVLLGIGAVYVVGLLGWPDSHWLLQTVSLYRLASYSLMIFWLLPAMWRRRPAGIRLVGLGSFLLMLTMLLFRFDVFIFWNGFPLSRVVLTNLGYLSALFCYSLYLAQDLALTSRRLAEQLERVKALSEENRAREQQHKELLERQKGDLEVLVKIRTGELTQKNGELEAQKQEITRQKAQLQELDLLKSRFFANISHEFRTPLTLLLAPIKKHLDLAQEPDDLQEYAVMHRNASQLLYLVNQLLDLSRVEAGSLRLKRSEGEWVSFCAGVIGQFNPLTESRNIDFRFEAPPEIKGWFDPDKLEKILYNLLINAFKFTPSTGAIRVKLQVQEASNDFPEGFVLLQVQDSGIGIAAEHLTSIFERFYQIDHSLQREYEGTGLGLALTKELVELHQGRIRVTSQPGEGTTFAVSLPLGTGHLSPEERETFALQPERLPLPLVMAPMFPPIFLEPNEAEGSQETILLVEDNADLREFLRLNLHHRYKVLVAANGQEGVDIALRKIPDLVLSDLMMPKMDGMELCQQLKNDERTCHIPILLLTAKVDVETKLQGYQTGADAYMPKPFDLHELQVRIKNLLDNRKKLRDTYTRFMTLKPSEVKVVSADDRFLQKCLTIVETNLADGSFGVEVFAREIGMSQVQLYRKVRALTGYTPNEFIRSMRLQRAHDLLSQRAGNVAEVAYDTGFSNLSYFAKCFRLKFGQLPSQFLNKQQPAPTNSHLIKRRINIKESRQKAPVKI